MLCVYKRSDNISNIVHTLSTMSVNYIIVSQKWYMLYDNQSQWGRCEVIVKWTIYPRFCHKKDGDGQFMVKEQFHLFVYFLGESGIKGLLVQRVGT